MNNTSNRPDGERAFREVGANNFDAMRFIAAVAVIYSHCFPVLFGQDKGFEPLSKISGDEFTLGTVAVDAFFLISGFLIVMSWERSSSPLSYLWKRIARIVPGYVCATLIGLFVVTPIFVKPGQTWLSLPVVGHCAKAMLHLLAFEVGGVFPLNPFPGVVNGSIWSVSYEFKCYLGVLFLGLIGAARRRWIALILFPCSLVLCALHLFAKPFDFITLHWSAIRLDSYFAAGAVFYLYRDRISIKPGWAVLSIAAIVGSLLLPVTLHLVLPVCGTYLLFWTVFQPYVTAHSFAKYGDFSYGIYLYAFPIQQMLVATHPGIFSPVGLFFVAAPLSILAGILSWYAVERHFLRKRRAHRLVPASAVTPAAATANYDRSQAALPNSKV
ncbi:MAG: acyltransferase family protein [Limisphaerales bacterium]